MRRPALTWLLPLLGGALVMVVLMATALGAVSLSVEAMVGMMLSRIGLFTITPTWSPAEEAIFLQLRLPRVVAAALVGAALATAGALFQGLLRNPLADPYIMGTSAGAAFGATLALLLALGSGWLGLGAVPVAAFVGAMITVLFVYRLARVGNRTPVISMLLAGFAVSSLLAAAMSFLLTVNDRLQLRLSQVFAFLMGGIATSGWGSLAVVGPSIILGALLAFGLARRLNAFALGEEGAAYLGLEVERDKTLILALGSLLTGAAVSVSGLVGFVGLVVPHAVRLVVGPDHRRLLPTASLVGAIFLVLSDLLARTLLAPTELPVGILTALVGAPFFLYLLRRSKREYAL